MKSSGRAASCLWGQFRLAYHICKYQDKQISTLMSYNKANTGHPSLMIGVV